jgi:glycosyltransferase involved in cell wall biosynthesis
VGNAPLAPGLAGSLESFDLIHLHYPFYFGAEQVWATARRRGVSYVVTYHQDVIFHGPLSLAAKAHHRVLGERILNDARLVIATSIDYARHSRLTRLPTERVVEVPNGVDTHHFRPGLSTDRLRTRYGLAGTAPVVLFVASLDRAHYFKGLSVLLSAMTRVRDAALIVVGDGDERQRYEREAFAAGLGDRVRFAGRVDDSELPNHYALADVTVLPSVTRGEAFGLVLVESMAAGTPVIASSLPGVRTLVDDGRTGFLCAPGDRVNLAARINAILADPARRLEMGRLARERVVQTYRWRRVVDRLEGVYTMALGRTVAQVRSDPDGKRD